MNRLEAKQILLALQKRYPCAKIMLSYSNNFELLVAVMLSAQTTDVQVNKVTRRLFPKYRKQTQNVKLKTEKHTPQFRKVTPEITEISNFANADLKTLGKDINSVGLYKMKAKNIKRTAQLILVKFRGKIPKTMDEMLMLPGVGRKTANVVLWNAYGVIGGIAVDTHVIRRAKELGLTNNTDPGKIEKDLMTLFAKKDWPMVTYLLIEYGRDVRKNKNNKLLLA